MDKREFIKKYIDNMENEEAVSFVYHFIKGMIDKELEKKK